MTFVKPKGKEASKMMQRPIARIVSALLVLVALVPVSSMAQGGVAAVASNQPGFPASPPNSTFVRQSPVIAEIVPANFGKEIAIGSREGLLSVLSSDGRLLWQQQVPPTLCANAAERLQTNPAVGTLDGNGTPYVVIGYGGIYPKGNANYCPGGVAAFNGITGALKWRLAIDTVQPADSSNLTGVLSTPALADVDGNGTLEVAFGSLDRHQYLLDNNGNLLWRFHTADTIWSSPLFANVDGDNRLDVVFGSDIRTNSGFGTTNGGFVYAFKTTPASSANKRIGFSGDPSKIENLIWRSANYDQVIYSSPALGDVVGDSKQELVVSSGCFYPEGSSAKSGRWIKIIDLATGRDITTIPLPFCSRSSPALGDLDGNGKLDIALAITGEAANGGDGSCRVGAWRGDGTQLWLKVPTLFGTFSDPGCDNLQAPSIADIDRNGSLEVLSTNGLGVVAFDGENGTQLTDQNPPTMSIPNQNLGTNSMPVVGDLDNNGSYEVVIGGLGSVFAWTGLETAISSPARPDRRAGSTPWPMFRGNALRNGAVTPDPTLRVISRSTGATLQADSGRVTGVILLGADGGATLRWAARESLPWLSLNQAEGTTTQQLVVTFDPSAVQNNPGIYEGVITISSPDGAVGLEGEGGSGTMRDVQVRLVLVNEVNRQLLPVVLR